MKCLESATPSGRYIYTFRAVHVVKCLDCFCGKFANKRCFFLAEIIKYIYFIKSRFVILLYF